MEDGSYGLGVGSRLIFVFIIVNNKIPNDHPWKECINFILRSGETTTTNKSKYLLLKFF